MNLLFITADEMRGDCLAANGLNPDIRTPNLDRLALEGIRLARHFTTFPKCVPARVSLTTGRYCHTDGYRNIHQHLPASQPDLLSALLKKGYEIALFGKNHCWENLLESSHNPPELPDGATPGHAIAHHSWTPAFRAIYKEIEATRAPSLENRVANRDKPVKPFDGSFQDEAYTRQSIHFLRTVRDPLRPFYLHVNLEAPHPQYYCNGRPGDPDYYDPAAITPFPRDLPKGAPLALTAQRRHRLPGHRDEATLREIQARYYAMITRVDAKIGRILDALDQAGLRDSTIVVFLSDHGDFAGQYSLPEKWDTTFADCLTHVPCIFRAPGLPCGVARDALSDHTDIAPTLCTLLGIDPLPGMHGTSLLPLLQHGTPVREAVFATGGHEREMRRRVDRTADPAAAYHKFATYQQEPDSMAVAMCVRSNTHKLIWRETGDHGLYDLTTDRWELTNRFADPALASVRHDLMARLLDWQLATWTDRPRQNIVGP